MRKVVSGLFISLDGVVEAPDTWQFAFDEEMGAAVTATLEAADAVLLGRVTYTEWAGYWPRVTSGEDADFLPARALIRGPVARTVATPLSKCRGTPVS